MAADKKSFVLYTDSNGLIKQLPDDVAGRLLKHIFAYVNDENPISDELLLNIAFEPIKMHLKRDLKKFELIKERRSEAGKKGGIKSGEVRKIEKNEANASFATKNEANEAVSDSVNDNVSVSDNVNEKKEVVDNSTNFDNSKNIHYSKILKTEALQWQETVAMQLKVPPDLIPKKLDEFTIFLSTIFKAHPNKKEFISHFINWLPKNLSNDKSSINNSGPKQQFKFSTTEAIETITRGSA